MLGVTTIYWVQCAYDLYARPRSSGHRLRQSGNDYYIPYQCVRRSTAHLDPSVSAESAVKVPVPRVPEGKHQTRKRRSDPNTHATRQDAHQKTPKSQEKKKKTAPISTHMYEVYTYARTIQDSGVRLRPFFVGIEQKSGEATQTLVCKLRFGIIYNGFGPPDEPCVKGCFWTPQLVKDTVYLDYIACSRRAMFRDTRRRYCNGIGREKREARCARGTSRKHRHN